MEARKLKGRTISKGDWLYFNHNQPAWKYGGWLRNCGIVQTIEEKRVELRIQHEDWWEYIWCDDMELFFEDKKLK